MPDSLHDLAGDLREFAAARDWLQYHAPKNLAAALVVEAGELLENFQWLTEAESRSLSPEKLADVRGEVGDVLIYLVQFCTAMGIDPVEAAREKLAVNAKRFPSKRSTDVEKTEWAKRVDQREEPGALG
jgi:NTP pyrophosphatase (non-canonical NTP hydrolase)